MNERCIFCALANGDPDKLVWQNDVAAAFKDIHPKSPVHVLVVPKQHFENIDDLDDPVLAGKLLLAAREVAEKNGVKGAWRMIVNNGERVGQSVPHLHFHIRGGEELTD